MATTHTESEQNLNLQANLAAVDELQQRLARAAAGGGPVAHERQRARGKLPVRERIERVLDPASPFLELSPLAAEGMYDGASPGAGIVTGIGRIGGREVVDRRQRSDGQGRHLLPDDGQEAPAGARDRARQPVSLPLPRRFRRRVPAAPERGLSGQGAFRPHLPQPGACSRREGLRQVAIVLGSCTAGGAYVPAMCDEAVIVRGAGTIFLAGPPLVKAATGEEVTAEELGGADVHGRISGVVDYVAEDEAEALALARDLMSAPRPARRRLPWQREPIREPEEDPEDLLATRPARSAPRRYDVREVLRRVLDGSALREFKADYGQTLVCGFGHLYGIPVGVIANNGVLFPESARKGAHFVMLCAQQRIPLLFFQNITGFIVGRRYEHEGIARDGAKMVAAVAVAQVPKITRDDRGQLWRGELRDVRPRLRPAIRLLLADAPHRRDGWRAGGRRVDRYPS